MNFNKKPVIERYKDLDKKSSNENWNDDFGISIIDVFENAIIKGELDKTVEEMFNEIEKLITK